MKYLKALALILVALSLFVFAALAVDQERISLRFLSWQSPQLSAFWWLLIALVIGLSLGMSYGAWLNIRLRFANRRLQKAVDQVQQQSLRQTKPGKRGKSEASQIEAQPQTPPDPSTPAAMLTAAAESGARNQVRSAHSAKHST